MALPTTQSPTLAAPRLSKSRFTSFLSGKDSPAAPYAGEIYDVLVAQGVDVSFALAHFRVESQYGTAGHALVTKSWGNMLSSPNLTQLACGTYSPGNGYTYAKYCSWIDSIKDYCRYIHDYTERRNLPTIYQSTAEWIGKPEGSSGHLSYVNIIISDMVAYENPPGTFYETGDKMIYAGKSLKGDRIIQRYPITSGLPLYRGTNGDLLKNYSGSNSNAQFLGLVNNSPAWGLIRINTSSADPNGTLVYIKNIDVSKIITVA